MILLSALLLVASQQSGVDDDCDGCKRPCLDYVGIGKLMSSGKSRGAGFFGSGDTAFMAHGMQQFRYAESRSIVGDSLDESIEVERGAYSTSRFPWTPALVAFSLDRKGEIYFPGWSPIWKDRAGRSFIPIFAWPPEGSRRWSDWRPESIHRFAKPIDYDLPQPMQDSFYVMDEDETDLVRMIDGKPRPRLGLYVSDVSAMLRAAEPCSDRPYR